MACVSFSTKASLCRVKVCACETRALDLECFALEFCALIDFCKYFVQLDRVKNPS